MSCKANNYGQGAGRQRWRPLPGVNILVKGSTRGTVTGVDGAFSLSADAGDILTISLVGYKKIEVPVQVGTPMAIRLESASTGLDELVVVGDGVPQRGETMLPII